MNSSDELSQKFKSLMLHFLIDNYKKSIYILDIANFKPLTRPPLSTNLNLVTFDLMHDSKRISGITN